MSNPRVGSLFDDVLSADGIRDEVRDAALKQLLAWHIDQMRRVNGPSKSALAERKLASRSQVERLLDPSR